MTKFAAKFGYTRQDLEDDPDLNFRVKSRFAKDHGHDPTGLDEWVIIVRVTGEVVFYPYWVDAEPRVLRQGDRGWTDQTPLRDPPLPLE